MKVFFSRSKNIIMGSLMTICSIHSTTAFAEYSDAARAQAISNLQEGYSANAYQKGRALGIDYAIDPKNGASNIPIFENELATEMRRLRNAEYSSVNNAKKLLDSAKSFSLGLTLKEKLMLIGETPESVNNYFSTNNRKFASLQARQNAQTEYANSMLESHYADLKKRLTDAGQNAAGRGEPSHYDLMKLISKNSDREGWKNSITPFQRLVAALPFSKSNLGMPAVLAQELMYVSNLSSSRMQYKPNLATEATKKGIKVKPGGLLWILVALGGTAIAADEVETVQTFKKPTLPNVADFSRSQIPTSTGTGR